MSGELSVAADFERAFCCTCVTHSVSMKSWSLVCLPDELQKEHQAYYDECNGVIAIVVSI